MKEFDPDLRHLSMWFAKRYNLEWRELENEAWLRMKEYGTENRSIAVHHAAWKLLPDERYDHKKGHESIEVLSDYDAEPYSSDNYDIEWLDLFERSTVTLSDQQRRAFFLYVLGYRHDEIAKAMNVSKQWSKNLVAMAKKRLSISTR